MKPARATATTPVLTVKDDPQYKPHRNRLDDLQDQLAGYDKQIVSLEHASNAVGRKAIVEAIANGADVREVEPQNDNRALLNVAIEQRAAVVEAIAIVEARERTAFSEARARYLDHARVEHAEITRAMAEALIALGLAQEAATAFGERVRAGGAGDWPSMFGPLGITRMGMPANERSTFASWLIGAVSVGGFDLNKIPPHWRKAWGALTDLERAKGDTTRLHEVTTKVRKHTVAASAPSARARSRREGW